VGVVVSDESFRTVVALFFLGVVFSVGWASHTIFSVPEGKFRWADTFVGLLFVDHLSFLDDLAFTLVGGWVEGSWGITFHEVASLGGVVVNVVLRAGLASLVNSVINVWSGASDAVVEDFIESSWAAWLDLILSPAWVWVGEGLGSSGGTGSGRSSGSDKVLRQDADSKGDNEESLEGEGHEWVNFKL
jgi:hypothetical protein